MTVGELKALLKNVDDSTPVATFRANMEGSGYTDKYIRATLQKMFRYKETRYDAFDGIEYKADVLSSFPKYDDNLSNEQTVNCFVIE